MPKKLNILFVVVIVGSLLFFAAIASKNKPPSENTENPQTQINKTDFNVDGFYFGQSKDSVNDLGKTVYSSARKFQVYLEETIAYGIMHLGIEGDVFFEFDKKGGLNKIYFFSEDSRFEWQRQQYVRIKSLFTQKYGKPKKLVDNPTKNITHLEWISMPQNIKVTLSIGQSGDAYRCIAITYTPLEVVK